MPRQEIKKILLAGATLGALAFGTLSAQAGGLGIREQSASGQGMSFAGEGTSSMGLSGMFWNPAAVTNATGFDSEMHLTTLFINTNINAGPGSVLTGAPFNLPASSGNIAEFAYIPSSYFGYKINQNWYAGLSVTAPYGAGTHPNDPWAGSFYVNEARLRSIEFNPVLGYKFNDQLSFAAGPRILWLFNGKFNQEPGLLIGNSTPAGFNSLGDIAWGYSLGLTYKPWLGTEFALGYKSRVNTSLEGDFLLPGAVNLTSPGTTVNVPVTGKATIPDQINFGVKQRIDDRWTALGTVEWTHWSTLQQITFTVDGVGAVAGKPITFNYRDGWFFSGGLEYKWTSQTTLRGGIAYEISPVRDQYRDLSVPDDNRWWFSAGLTHQLDRNWTLDFGYSFVWLGKSPIDYTTGQPDFVPPFTLLATSKTYDNIVSIGLRSKFGADPAPLITK